MIAKLLTDCPGYSLATGPLILAAGGISNIFLHKLAENIRDAYAKAPNIAEKGCLLWR